jgi:hypothetical protein
MEIFNQILDILTPIIVASSPVLGGVCIVLGRVLSTTRKTKKELTKVLDKSATENNELHELALKEGLTWGAKEIQKLFKKK